MSRRSFIQDALFGMPGVPAEAGSCIILDDWLPTERFQHPWTEATYQVWLRGYNSKALDVRDELSGMMKSEGPGDDDTTPGGVSKGEIGLLLGELQDRGFLPKRPGD